MIAFFVLIMLLIGLDQLSKWAVLTYLAPIGSQTILPKILTFSYVENRGAAFGLMENARWVFIVVTIIAMAAILWYYLKKRPDNKLLVTSLILLAAGAVGNFMDRLFLGYVVDFIQFSFFNFTCNIADIYLTLGVGLLILYIFFLDKSEEEHGTKR